MEWDELPFVTAMVTLFVVVCGLVGFYFYDRNLDHQEYMQCIQKQTHCECRPADYNCRGK